MGFHTYERSCQVIGGSCRQAYDEVAVAVSHLSEHLCGICSCRPDAYSGIGHRFAGGGILDRTGYVYIEGIVLCHQRKYGQNEQERW